MSIAKYTSKYLTPAIVGNVKLNKNNTSNLNIFLRVLGFKHPLPVFPVGMSSGTNGVFIANKSFSSLRVQPRRMYDSRVSDYKKIHAPPLLSLRNSANVRDFPVCGAFYFFSPVIFFTPVFVFGPNPLVPTNTYRFFGT